jgi:isopentenyl-diphosphate delta-isomerase
MTGGTQEAMKINRDIARAVQKLRLGMGVGSQRAMMEDLSLASTYQVRDIAPDIFLAGNIGIAQLKEYPVEKIRHALDEIGADALAVHLNAAQEAVQPEGDTDFAGALNAIERTVRKLGRPVIAKEVGHGIDEATAHALAKTGVAAMDVQGAGGTSWTAIESFRKNSGVGKAYWDFGIPTAASLMMVRKAFDGPVIASGGIRSGLDAVKALALGANVVSMARPIFLAQQKGGSKDVEEFLIRFIEEMRVGLFLLGAQTPPEATKRKPVLSGRLKDWVEA